ncbi:MAG: hypothetical protein IJA16_01725, partial [Clostridia bacterium]|nr:hypothetical protein [Clostridia bacterium]
HRRAFIGIFRLRLDQLLDPVFTAAVHTAPDRLTDGIGIIHLGGGAKQGIRQQILLEVNIGQEQSKSGFQRDEILPLFEQNSDFSHILGRRYTERR